jgi:hypothetical protein
MKKIFILQGFFMIFSPFDPANSFTNRGNRVSAKSSAKSPKIPAASFEISGLKFQIAFPQHRRRGML